MQAPGRACAAGRGPQRQAAQVLPGAAWPGLPCRAPGQQPPQHRLALKEDPRAPCRGTPEQGGRGRAWEAPSHMVPLPPAAATDPPPRNLLCIC